LVKSFIQSLLKGLIMSSIAIITDTNASLPDALVKKHNIILVPIQIQFGEDSYTTGVDIDDEKLFKLIDARNVLPTTAAPSPAAFEGAYQKAFDAGYEQVICICCSSEVSATYNNAKLAAEAFETRDISVVDSKQLSLAEGFQVLAAAEAAEAGEEKANILPKLEVIQKKSHVYGALPTLKYLAMGGRVGKLAAGFGNTLEIKPILTSRDGKLDLLEKVRTWRKAKQRLVDLGVESVDGKPIVRVGMVHVNNESGVMALYDSLKEALALPEESILAEFTPGLSVHTGSGVIAFVVITE
jgi:DegV family protein with EDD domain